MKEEIKKYLLNSPIDKLVSIFLGVIIVWLIIKAIKKYLLSKIKDNEVRYRAKKSINFIGYILTIILFAVVYSDKLGKFTVALGVAGAGIAFALQQVIASFAGWLTIL